MVDVVVKWILNISYMPLHVILVSFCNAFRLQHLNLRWLIEKLGIADSRNLIAYGTKNLH